MNSNIVLLAGCLVLFTIVGDKVAAEVLVPKIYEELGCKQVNNGELISFDCSNVESYANDKCYFKGKTYNHGEVIPEADEPKCRPSCRCRLSEIICTHVDCPEYFGGGRSDPSCVNKYDDLKQCCRSGEVCGESLRTLGKCEFEGKSYHVGQKMYPEGSTCYTCLCSNTFDNTTSLAENPDCQKVDCGFELKLPQWKSGCVPLYYDKPTCCSIDTKCPSKDDSIVPGSGTSDDKTCKFGELTLKRGDQLKTSDKCVKCECSVPPYLTCVKLPDCQ